MQADGSDESALAVLLRAKCQGGAKLRAAADEVLAAAYAEAKCNGTRCKARGSHKGVKLSFCSKCNDDDFRAYCRKPKCAGQFLEWHEYHCEEEDDPRHHVPEVATLPSSLNSVDRKSANRALRDLMRGPKCGHRLVVAATLVGSEGLGAFMHRELGTPWHHNGQGVQNTMRAVARSAGRTRLNTTMLASPSAVSLVSLGGVAVGSCVFMYRLVNRAIYCYKNESYKLRDLVRDTAAEAVELTAAAGAGWAASAGAGVACAALGLGPIGAVVVCCLASVLAGVAVVAALRKWVLPKLGSGKKQEKKKKEFLREAEKYFHLKPGYSKQDVQRAYYHLAKKHHPDRRGGDTKTFQLLVMKYAFLLADVERRRGASAPAPPQKERAELLHLPAAVLPVPEDQEEKDNVGGGPDIDLPAGHDGPVHRWLEGLGCVQYADALVLDGWDNLERVALLTEEDLLELGIKKRGHRRAILKGAKDQAAGN